MRALDLIYSDSTGPVAEARTWAVNGLDVTIASEAAAGGWNTSEEYESKGDKDG